MTPHPVEAMIVGTAQDGGLPQLGCDCAHCQAARIDRSRRRLVASMAILDHENQKIWIIDASPDMREQMDLLVSLIPGYHFAGILLTHAHIGHYLGLAFLGRESWDQQQFPVFGTRRMIDFLRTNQPWKQLVDLGNIAPVILVPERPASLGSAIHVVATLVPHRDELSDTVAFSFTGPNRTLVYCPDIDRWEGQILQIIRDADIALLDGTFYSADELPGRNRSEIPHPCIIDSIEKFKGYDTDIRFVHLNHSNRLLSDQGLVAQLQSRGFDAGEQGDVWAL